MKRITTDDFSSAMSDMLEPDLRITGPEDKPLPPLSLRRAGRIQHVESTREKRDRQQQDVGFSSRPFTLCNLPVRPVKNRAVYERRNGNFFLRIEAGQGRQLPYGRDRLVLILVATMAVQQQSRVVKLGSATEILRLFGRSQSGTHYRKLMESFDRIFSATIYWGSQGQLENRRFIEQYRVSMLDHVRLWYCDAGYTHGAAFDNVVTLRGRLKRVRPIC